MPPLSVSLPKYGKEPLPATGTGPPDEDPRHRYLADYCRQLLQISESFMANRWPKWQDADKRLRCYVDVTEVDEFTTRDTLIQIEARPGRNPRAAFLMEEILNYNLENLWHNGRLKLYAWLNDT